MAVDQQKSARTKVVQTVEAAYAGGAINTVGRNIEAAHRTDDVSQRTDTRNVGSGPP